MTPTIRALSEAEAPLAQFHDCHVNGLKWDSNAFTFSLAIEYILEWIGPSGPSGYYQFLLAEGELVFRGASDPQVWMDWRGSALYAEIAEVSVIESRATPTGMLDRLFKIEFSEPDGSITVWSTGYEVVLSGTPIVSNTQTIPRWRQTPNRRRSSRARGAPRFRRRLSASTEANRSPSEVTR